MAGRAEGQRLRQHCRRHQRGHDRELRRHLEGAGGAQGDRHGEQKFTVRPVAVRGEGQHAPDHALDHHAGGQDPAAVVAVQHMAGGQREQQGRQELQQADHAEVPGAAGQVVHLPADGHHQHLVGGAADHAAPPEAHEGAQAPQRRCRHGKNRKSEEKKGGPECPRKQGGS
jgi:hypothetical protein